MTIRVEHREDELLQKQVERGVPAGAEGTYVEKVTVPHHAMLLRFLEAKLIGVDIADKAELLAILATWPNFAQENGLTVHSDWDTIAYHEAEQFIAMAGSLGGPFVIGMIKSL